VPQVEVSSPLGAAPRCRVRRGGVAALVGAAALALGAAIAPVGKGRAAVTAAVLEPAADSTLAIQAAAAPVPVPGAGSDALATITPARLLSTVSWLASPEFAGRLAGTPGYARAARALADSFRAAGLRPGTADGYLQHFPIEANTILACRLDLVREGREPKRYALGDDYVCRGFSGSGRVTAGVVFVGYGLSLPDHGYDDYAGADVRGRIVLAFKQPPAWTADASGWGDAHLPRPKAATAAAHGARALLLIDLPDSTRPATAPIGSVLHGPGEQNRGFPQLQVSAQVAADLLTGSGATLISLRREIDLSHAPASRPLPAVVAVEVRARYREAADGLNVVGIIPGKDPALAGECVVVGAHLDHVGRQAQLLFPGANDNASGVAALLALARAFTRGADAPARTMVFALFAGEEQGLCGAKAYVTRPPWPLARTAAMLNIDCVACGDSIQLGGGKGSPRLWELARGLDAARDRRTVARTWSGGGADATPFFEAGIPTLYFATTNGYAHLHLPSDTPATLDPGLHAAVARLAFLTAAAVASGDAIRETPAAAR
jgi:aminopeptidase YwaD